MSKFIVRGALLCLLTTAAAQAQRMEFSLVAGYPRWNAAKLGSSADRDGKDTDTRILGREGYGARLTLNTRGYYGHEVGYMYNRAVVRARVGREGTRGPDIFREDEVPVRQAFYNFLMYFMPAGERLRPFMTGGVQAHDYAEPGFSEWKGFPTRNYGLNYGGGLKLKLFKHALVRVDVRQYIGGKPYDLTFEDPVKSGGLVRQLEGSVGVGFMF